VEFRWLTWLCGPSWVSGSIRSTFLRPRTDRIAVKNVVFPFRVFPDLDPVLGPEMQSTGESMGVGATFGVAYWKAWLGAGLRSVPFGDTVYISAPQENTQAIHLSHGRFTRGGLQDCAGARD